MMQLSFPASKGTLMVRAETGDYQIAMADQILEAARQAIQQKVQRGESFRSPVHVQTYLRTQLSGYEHEVFAVLFLDTKLRLIEYAELFHGTIDGASVYPREVVKAALTFNAAAMVIAHNHPSGDPEPSAADRALTKRLAQALALVDVRILDHVVVGGNATVSFAERGLL
ncbi:RadC family protein [Proteus mirabilis]|uniref:RadC family protein n=1 Tax=Proteus mirabilis TaxID=584 RepID=UPI00106FB428|nr:DNA repair protein RadC [Proteus mirabilis]